MLHLEKLIFHIWEPDAQRQAPIGGSDIPFCSQGPGPWTPAAAWLGDIEHGCGDLIHGGHMSFCDLEHQLGTTEDLGKWHSPGVAAGCIDSEGGLLAGGSEK